jgi:TetR/AcrR family transcriptional regulator, repressor for uid operon
MRWPEKPSRFLKAGLRQIDLGELTKMATKRKIDPERGEQRRHQVLDAAMECFQRSGFQGASMAQISQAAGMSVGHIYHYFENKEAIIAAMVERDVDRLKDDFEAIRAQDDVAAAMLDHAADVMTRPERMRDGTMRIEMLAEAARNPRIAEILQSAHRKIGEMVVGAMRDADPDLGDKEARLKFELLSLMIGGFDSALIRSPNVDRSKLAKELLTLFGKVICRRG